LTKKRQSAANLNISHSKNKSVSYLAGGIKKQFVTCSNIESATDENRSANIGQQKYHKQVELTEFLKNSSLRPVVQNIDSLEQLDSDFLVPYSPNGK
jgi:hypothetical protein